MNFIAKGVDNKRLLGWPQSTEAGEPDYLKDNYANYTLTLAGGSVKSINNVNSTTGHRQR